MKYKGTFLEVSKVEQEPVTRKHAQQIMDFRQSLVAELANPFLDYGQIKKLIAEKAALRYEMPWSTD